MDVKKILDLDPDEIFDMVISDEMPGEEAGSILIRMLDEISFMMSRNRSSCRELVDKMNIVCKKLRKYATDQNMLKFMYFGQYELALMSTTMLSDQRRRIEDGDPR